MLEKQQVWGKSHRLTLKVYEITATFPREELYGLTSHIRRACASLPTNIAEGVVEKPTWISHDFFQITMGSASAVEYLFMLANSLDFIENIQYNELNDEIVEIKKCSHFS
ncbi:four helix bundle protein [candidate division KSB1 bacterium]|nr:four helix bundle protein [candidate division KSB1 bacterium]